MHDLILALQVRLKQQASKEKLETLELDRYKYGEKKIYCT